MSEESRHDVGQQQEQHIAKHALGLVVRADEEQTQDEHGQRDHKQPSRQVGEQSQGGGSRLQIRGDGDHRHDQDRAVQQQLRHAPEPALHQVLEVFVGHHADPGADGLDHSEDREDENR